MPALASAVVEFEDPGEMAPHLLKRGVLSVNHTQAVTLGIMAVYVVVIALLWNLPYVRWSLWPFKVSDIESRDCQPALIHGLDVGDRLPRVWPRDHRLLHRRTSQVNLA